MMKIKPYDTAKRLKSFLDANPTRTKLSFYVEQPDFSREDIINFKYLATIRVVKLELGSCYPDIFFNFYLLTHFSPVQILIIFKFIKALK